MVLVAAAVDSVVVLMVLVAAAVHMTRIICDDLVQNMFCRYVSSVDPASRMCHASKTPTRSALSHFAQLLAPVCQELFEILVGRDYHLIRGVTELVHTPRAVTPFVCLL